MAVIRDELLGAPLAGGAVIVLLENLEPTIADCRVGNSIVDFLHVHRTRTFVADIDRAWLGRIRPVTELERQLGTSVCTANAWDTILAVDTTGHVFAGNSSNGADRIGRLLNVIAHADASTITLRNIIDKEVREESMSIHSCCGGQSQQQGTGDGKSHVGCFEVPLKGS